MGIKGCGQAQSTDKGYTYISSPGDVVEKDKKTHGKSEWFRKEKEDDLEWILG